METNKEWNEAELAAPAMQPCDYCGTLTQDDSAMPVCAGCAGKISRHEHGTCYDCGAALDVRGMCCAPLSVAD